MFQKEILDFKRHFNAKFNAYKFKKNSYSKTATRGAEGGPGGKKNVKKCHLLFQWPQYGIAIE